MTGVPLSPRAFRLLGRSAIAIGAFLVALGLAMPAIAVNLIHDPTARAQQEVDRASGSLFGVTLNLGTKVSVFGTVEDLVNVTDLDFIPEDFPLRLASLRLRGFDGLVIFDNRLGFVNGETAVVEGYYFSFSYNNTTYSVVTGSSLPSIGIAIATGLVSGALAPAKVFRPWWEGTGLALELTGGVVIAGGIAGEALARRAPPPAPVAGQTPAPSPPKTPPSP